MRRDDRLAAARGLAAGRISTLTGLVTRTVYAEPSDGRSADVLVTLLVIVPGPDIDAALAAIDKEVPRGA